VRLSIRIRSARTQSGLSQLKLAERLGVSRSAVANWESTTAAVSPTLERLAELSIETAVSFEWLATGRGARALVHEPTALPGDHAIDPTERRLLQAFRNCRPALRESLLLMAEGASSRRRR